MLIYYYMQYGAYMLMCNVTCDQVIDYVKMEELVVSMKSEQGSEGTFKFVEERFFFVSHCPD